MKLLVARVLKRDITKIALVTFAVVIAILWGTDFLLDRRYRIAIIEPTPLLSISPVDYPKTNPELATLQPGTAVRVLRLRYGKDFQTFQVKTNNSVVGWVVGGKGVKVLADGVER